MIEWHIVKKYSQRAGKEVLALSEAAFRTLQDPELALSKKTILVGAIAYLLLPLDAIPDFLPGGYADDVTVLLSAVVSAGKMGKKHLAECRLKHGLTVKEEDVS